MVLDYLPGGDLYDRIEELREAAPGPASRWRARGCTPPRSPSASATSTTRTA